MQLITALLKALQPAEYGAFSERLRREEPERGERLLGWLAYLLGEPSLLPEGKEMPVEPETTVERGRYYHDCRLLARNLEAWFREKEALNRPLQQQQLLLWNLYPRQAPEALRAVLLKARQALRRQPLRDESYFAQQYFLEMGLATWLSQQRRPYGRRMDREYWFRYFQQGQLLCAALQSLVEGRAPAFLEEAAVIAAAEAWPPPPGDEPAPPRAEPYWPGYDDLSSAVPALLAAFLRLRARLNTDPQRAWPELEQWLLAYWQAIDQMSYTVRQDTLVTVMNYLVNYLRRPEATFAQRKAGWELFRDSLKRGILWPDRHLINNAVLHGLIAAEHDRASSEAKKHLCLEVGDLIDEMVEKQHLQQDETYYLLMGRLLFVEGRFQAVMELLPAGFTFHNRYWDFNYRFLRWMASFEHCLARGLEFEALYPELDALEQQVKRAKEVSPAQVTELEKRCQLQRQLLKVQAAPPGQQREGGQRLLHAVEKEMPHFWLLRQARRLAGKG